MNSSFWQGFEKQAFLWFKKKEPKAPIEDGVVHYHAPWSNPAIQASDAVAKAVPKDVPIRYIDVDKEEGDTKVIPYTAVYRKGKLVDSVVGNVGEDGYRRLFEKAKG